MTDYLKDISPKCSHTRLHNTTCCVHVALFIYIFCLVRVSLVAAGPSPKAQFISRFLFCAPQPKPIDVQVITHHMQRYAVWFGGSMLASTVSSPPFNTPLPFSYASDLARWEALSSGLSVSICSTPSCLNLRTNVYCAYL